MNLHPKLTQLATHNHTYNHSMYIGTSPMIWKNLTLSTGRHSVTVEANCLYNGGIASTASRGFLFRVRN